MDGNAFAPALAEGQPLLPWHSSSQMVAVLRRPTRGRDTVADAVEEPPKPSQRQQQTTPSQPQNTTSARR